MTAEQINAIVEKYKAERDDASGRMVARSIYYDFDNQVSFRTGYDFVVFDESKELIHCICSNPNNNVKMNYPFSIISAGYEQLQYVEGNFDMKGLLDVLDSMFASLMSEKQMQVVKNWAMSMPNHYIAPMEAMPYHPDIVNIPYQEAKSKPRPDGRVLDVFNYPNGGNKEAPVKTTNTTKAAEVINKMEPGATMMISSSNGSSVDEALTLAQDDVTVIGNNTPVTNNVTVSAKDVTMKGIEFNNKNVDASANVLKVTGENTTLENCSLTGVDGVEHRTPILMNTPSFTVKGCTFDGTNGYYNLMEGSPNNLKTKKAVFEDCVFKAGASTNNFTSFYDFEENAEVSFVNCDFDAGPNTNPIRISNRSGAAVTFTISNCRYRAAEGGTNEYKGLVLLQDMSSDDTEDYTKTIINIINLTDFNGKAYAKNGGSDTCITGDTVDNSRRIWYVYDGTTKPVVNFQ